MLKIYVFFLIYVFFNLLATLPSIWHPSFPARDQTHTPCIGTEVFGLLKSSAGPPPQGSLFRGARGCSEKCPSNKLRGGFHPHPNGGGRLRNQTRVACEPSLVQRSGVSAETPCAGITYKCSPLIESVANICKSGHLWKKCELPTMRKTAENGQ